MEKLITKERLLDLVEYYKKEVGSVDSYYTINSCVIAINEFIEDCECEQEKEELEAVKKEIEQLDDEGFGIYVYDLNFKDYELIELITEITK